MKLSHTVRRLIFRLCLASLGAAAPAMAAAPALTINDYTARFLSFYADADKQALTPDQRWALWQKEYGIASVPPTPAGQALARKQLDTVWGQYAALLPRLPVLAKKARDEADGVLQGVAALLQASDQPVKVSLNLFVGQFDSNSFAYRDAAGVPQVFLEVEAPNADLTMTHEFTHAVQEKLGDLKAGYAAPLGETLLLEGLAMRVTQHLHPEHPVSDYTLGADWVKSCEAQHLAIYKGILPYVATADASNTAKFTYGTGVTGLKDEVYCAGWALVGQLVAQGHSYAELARTPEAQIPEFVRGAMQEELDTKR